MNKDVKVKWLRALRSNKWRQGKHWLRFTDEEGIVSHCCLGVLCELYVQEHGPIPSTKNSGSIPGVGDYFGDELKVVPNVVRKWAGLIDREGGVLMYNGAGKGTMTLPILNDYHLDFHQIADVIEMEL